MRLRQCLRCPHPALPDLAFCAICDNVLARDADAAKRFEAHTGYRHFLLLVRLARVYEDGRIGLGGCTRYSVAGTSRMDAPDGAWTFECDYPLTSRAMLVLVHPKHAPRIIRDKRFEDRIRAHPTVSVELVRIARLDDPKDLMWRELSKNTA